jgi:hypothetical protein
MNRHFFTAALALGALAIVWVAAGFWGEHRLALAMTALIALTYGVGAWELLRFRRNTAALSATLDATCQTPADLHSWLNPLNGAIRNAVRLRIEGERIGLPGPALTPYLVGLLVMLGMLGTFLGMVVTLDGAVFALEGSTDLKAMREAFSAPIKGLGLAFGTSVAGVASSAMLGLMSALSRRDRLQAAQSLDGKIATVLRPFSLTYQRQETFKALQQQSQALPAVAAQLQQLMAQMDSMSQQLNERLLSNQDRFHRESQATYVALAQSVDQSLRSSLSQSTQVVSDNLQPMVEAALSGIAREATQMHGRMVDATRSQLETLTQSQAASTTATMSHWLATLAAQGQAAQAQARQQQQEICATLATSAQQITTEAQASARQTLGEMTRLAATTDTLMQARQAADAAAAQQHSQQLDQLASLLARELGALREAEALRGDAAVARLGQLQTAVTTHLGTLGTALEAPITRLIETASEAPKAAAAVIGQLRQEISNNLVRDNALLEERSRILQTLNTLLDGINHAAVEQRSVIDALVAASALTLEQASRQFEGQVAVQAEKLGDVSAHITAGAIEVSSLSESFSFAVQAFGDANEKLIAKLQHLESAMSQSMTRSDEQLAYYVAQAREVIDLSLMSQREVFEELRRLGGKRPATQAPAATMATAASSTEEFAHG